MTISMFQACVPPFIRALTNLAAILDKGAAHAKARKIDEAVLLNSRLFVDMFPLVRQVQIATDMAKNGCARLAGVEPLAFPDDETTFSQLYARIDRALEYINGFGAEQLDGSEARAVSFMTRNNGEMRFDGQSYLLQFVLPNLFFHGTTAYAILREAGVALGKTDFLGEPPRAMA